MYPSTVWIGTSWKMTKTLGEACQWVDAVGRVPVPPGVRAFVLPPHTALATVRGAIAPSHRLHLGAQDGHWAPQGAWTGEVSMDQVRDAGATIVEIGHSERRLLLGEDDDVVARKVGAAVDAGLTPLLCVGEPADVRASGGHVEHSRAQMRSALAPLAPDERRGVVVAYEPVWSIGEHGSTATPEEVAPVVAALVAEDRRLTDGVGVMAVLYGGGVDVGNAPGLLEVEGVDGWLVGRAAWAPEGFLDLVRFAGEAVDHSARVR